MKELKIVSGGQTGVDRAALDAAIKHQIDTGGWCPEGRRAEDGAIPSNYLLTELPGAGYRQRTRQNVLDSDGTLIIYFDYLSGGTELTLATCIKQKKPYLLIDGSELSVQRAAQKVERFIRDKQIRILNAAGPRGSGEPRAYDYTFETLEHYFQICLKQAAPTADGS